MVSFMRWDNLRLDDQLAADQDTTAGETLFPAERRDVANKVKKSNK